MTDPRLDPEMAEFSRMMAERMEAQPAIVLPNPPRSAPFDTLRRLNDGPQEPLAEGGPWRRSSRTNVTGSAPQSGWKTRCQGNGLIPSS